MCVFVCVCVCVCVCICVCVCSITGGLSRSKIVLPGRLGDPACASQCDWLDGSFFKSRKDRVSSDLKTS